VDRIELIGGGARIPALFNLVKMIVSDESIIYKSFHSTEAIALGSSIQINKNPMETQFSLNTKIMEDIVITLDGYNQ
jgi:molecular chaperone DnaK (HSP70)